MSREAKALRMRQLVAKYHQSGASLRQFAMAHGMSRGKLNYWVQQFKDSSKTNAAADEEGSVKFIPIDLPERPDPEPRFIIISKPCGTEIKIPF